MTAPEPAAPAAPAAPADQARPDRDGAPPRSRAAVVAGGILASRLAGLVRVRAAAYFFGVGPHADVLEAALKGPNLLQNLLGEGTVSAAFIPVYSRLLAAGREREAGRFAGAIFGLLLALAAALALAGALLARPLVALLTPGFAGDAARVAAGELTVDRFELAVVAVRIIFPMTGLLTLSAWALGVLNSHRRFFLPYFAPVAWNAAILAGLFAGAWAAFGEPLPARPAALPAGALGRVLLAACWGALAGGAAQFAVQLPLVCRLLRGFRPSLSTRVEGVREALAAFGPVVAGRGVYQLAGYLDLVLASLLAAGALGALRYAQVLYLLPISLFGLSVAAAELPELARLSGEERAPFFARLRGSLAQMMFLTLPTALGYLAFGSLLVAALYRTGSFGGADQRLVYLVLCGYTLGLPATTASRLLQNTFYALADTRTPARIAVARVVAAAAVAVPLMLWLDRFPVMAGEAAGAGRVLFLGAVGLAAGSAVGAWLEVAALRRALAAKLPGFAPPWPALARSAALAAAALAPAAALAWALPGGWHPAARALAVVAAYGLAYLGGARLLGVPELAAWTGRLTRRSR
jgi:putative peptidoglycan lipid II flippase